MPKIVFWCVLLMCFAHVLCQFTEEEEVLKNKKKGGSGCGSHLVSANGGFHLNITNLNETCDFHITVVNTSNLILFFKTILLHEKDVVNVYKGESKNESLLSHPIQASNGSITVVLNELDVTIELSGTDHAFIRDFEGFYTTGEKHAIPLDESVTTLYSPICNVNTPAPVKIVYNSAQVHGSDAFSTFIFKQFNFTSDNSITFEDSSLGSGPYNNEPVEIFPTKSTVIITVQMKFPTNETYELKKHQVNSECSMFKTVDDHNKYSFHSPLQASLNGSDSYECHWLFQSKGKLGVQLSEMHFNSPLDIVAVTDGGNEFAPPLLQVTTSNLNTTKDVMIRSSGSYLWIAFKPVDFSSNVYATVSDSGDGGGYFRGQGSFKADKPTSDTTFMLEVDINQIVYLSFNESKLTSGAAIKIYDGFDQKNLLTTLRSENIWYPVMSLSTKMLVVATDFSQSSFEAYFEGIDPGCDHMSTFTNENYVLSKNCNLTCHWVISPQDQPGSDLLLNLQYISLQEGDSIEISRLDDPKTPIGSVSGNVSFVPQIVIPSSVGALVTTTRKSCSNPEKVFLVGHSSYLPACENLITVDALSKFVIVSPQYPDTYPLFASCKWNISTPKDNWVHLAFDALKLAPNHCIKINNVILNISDGGLPEDMLLPGNSVVEFNTGNCVKTKVASGLESSEGFKFNGTVANCGGVLNQKQSGEFEVPPNKTLCIWKVSVPETSGSGATENVNVISFDVSKKDGAGNYELTVYDGASVRDSPITNDTLSGIWSRTNTLIFIYRRVDLAKPSSIISIKYSTIGCNGNNQCDNKLCLHPDWRCDGKNDCGDFSDERNCASVPIPPEIKTSGYSSVAFWLTITLMFTTGIILGIAGPICYQKYKNGQYRRFNDIQ